MLRSGTVMHVDESRWIERQLLDPRAESASERRQLLAWMTEQGISIDEMTAAHARGQLTALAGDRALRPGVRMTPNQLAVQLRVDLELIRDVRRASGFPPLGDDEPGLTDDDVRMFALFELASGFFDRDAVLRLATVMGSSIRRIADAAGEMFLRDVEAPMKADSPVGEIEMASRIADIAIPGEVLVNDAMVERVSTASFEPAGRRSLKGFSDPVRVWALVG